MPGPGTSLTVAVVGGAQVAGLYAEALQCTITSGDHLKKRHDAFKMRRLQMCQSAGLNAEVVVFNL